jgi:Putative DNA-binding domain
MVALRSRRLETLLGVPLDGLRYEHLEALVTNHVSEAFDLDFKAVLYGNADKDRRDLATDVAALANTGGGLLVLGIEEDRQARAAAAPGVAVSDDEVRRILQVVGSLVVPLPVFEPLPVLKPGETGHGFLVVAVPRSPLAPHAVIVNQGLRFPRRNGTTTRYLSEPEVASAYRERLAGAQRQSARAEEVEGEALLRLDISDQPWVVVTLVPDLPGDLSLNSEVFTTFQQQITRQPATIVATGFSILRASVGRRRLLADGSRDDSPLARWVSLELHTDGSGVYSGCVLGAEPLGDGLGRQIPDEGIVIAVMSGLLHLARHARDRAAAGGNALIRAQIFPISPERPTGLGHTRHGFLDSRGARILTLPPQAAEAAAELDDLAQPGPMLAAASALLVDEIGQAFGVAEMGQLSRDGQLRRPYWGRPDVITWAQQNDIEITDDRLA